MTALRKSTQNHRGFSLIEMLVASAIFAIAAAVAFIMYSAAQKSYKSGEEYTDQQQSTRVAFDRMLSDIRLAGFNTNPDGDNTRVDEQVEGAWDTAVTIRGDFDFEDAAANTSPETALAAGVYNIVSTGNDEIVTYVLAKPGPSGPATLTLNLDANKPRTKTNSTITIPNVVLVQDNPPYTLYRVTLADVTGNFPASPQAATNFVYEPVAENIRTMTFRYYDDGGLEKGPNTPSSSGDDIGGADSSSVTRASIHKIHVDLVGMTKDPDLDYSDPADAALATTHYRKFNLDSDVNMENMGKTGIRDLDATPPPMPSGVTPVPGHARGMLVKWNTPSTSDGVSGYSIRYWPSGSPSSITTVSVAYPHVEYGTIDFDGHGYVGGLTNGTSYCFQVQAKDSAGNQSGFGPASAPCATTTNPTTPAAVVGLSATGNGSLAAEQNQVSLDWNDVQTNTSVLTGDPDTIGGNTILRDALQYDVKRCDDSTLTLNCQTFTQSPATSAYTDTSVQNCKLYYYKVWIEDALNVAGATSSLVYGQSTTTTLPSAPTGVTGTPSGPNAIALTWNAVTTDVASKTVTITSYKVYRAQVAYGTIPTTVPSGSFVLHGTTTGPATGTVTYTDALSNADHQAINAGQSFVYAITATDLCGNESARSTPIRIDCQTNNVSSLTTTPVNNASNGGVQSMSMSVNGTGSYTRGKVTVVRNSNNQQVYSQEVFGPGPYTFPSWDTTTAGAGVYTLYWEVELANGCIFSQNPPNTYTVVANLACQISPTNPNLSPTTGKPSNLNKNLAWDIINNSGKDLNLTRIDVSWTQSVLGNHKITALQYPTGTTVTTWGTGYQSVVAPSTSTATADYSTFPQLLPATANGLCPTCKINMGVQFDTQIVDTTNNGETVTIKYYFTDITNASGTCQFSIKPDLTIP